MAFFTVPCPAPSDVQMPTAVPPTLAANPSEFEEIVAGILVEANAVGSKIVTAHSQEQVPTFESAILPLAHLYDRALFKWTKIEAAKEFSPDAATVKLAGTAETAYDQGWNTFLLRQDVGDVVKRYWEQVSREVPVEPEELVKFRLAQAEYEAREKLGLYIVGDDVKAALETAQNTLDELRNAYRLAIKDRQLGAWYDPADLDGVDPDVIKEYSKKTNDLGQYWVRFEINDLFSLTRGAHKAATRERILTEDANKWADVSLELGDGTKMPIPEAFRKVLELEDECARLKGFKNAADARASRSLPGSAHEIEQFLTQAPKAIRGAAQKQVNDLLELKKSDYQKRGSVVGDHNSMYHWDNAYYIYKRTEAAQADRQAEAASNSELTDTRSEQLIIRDYLPLDHVIPTLFDWICTQFGLVIADLPDGAPTVEPWDPAVRLFGVWSAKSGEFAGHLYLDLFVRDNKQNQASTSTLQPAVFEDGQLKHLPAVILSLNMPVPAENRPALLEFGDFQNLLERVEKMLARFLGNNSGYTKLGPMGSRYIGYASVLPKVFGRLTWYAPFLTAFTRHYAYLSPTNEWLWRRNIARQHNMTDDFPAIRALALPSAVLPAQLAINHQERQFENQLQPMLRQLRYAKFDWVCNSRPSREALQELNLQHQYVDIGHEVVLTKGREQKPGVDQTLSNWRDVAGQQFLGIPQFLTSAGTLYRWMFAETLVDQVFPFIFPGQGVDDSFNVRFTKGYLGNAGIMDPKDALESAMGKPISANAFYERVCKMPAEDA